MTCARRTMLLSPVGNSSEPTTRIGSAASALGLMIAREPLEERYRSTSFDGTSAALQSLAERPFVARAGLARRREQLHEKQAPRPHWLKGVRNSEAHSSSRSSGRFNLLAAARISTPPPEPPPRPARLATESITKSGCRCADSRTEEDQRSARRGSRRVHVSSRHNRRHCPCKSSRTHARGPSSNDEARRGARVAQNFSADEVSDLPLNSVGRDRYRRKGDRLHLYRQAADRGTRFRAE